MGTLTSRQPKLSKHANLPISPNLFSLATSAMAAPQKNLFNQGPEVQYQTELVTGKKIDLNQICQNKVCIFTTTATA